MSFYEGKTFFVFQAREHTSAAPRQRPNTERKTKIMNTKKITALLLSLLTACTLFASCGKTEEAPAEEETKTEVVETTPEVQEEITETPAHDDSIVITMKDEPPTLNPYDHASNASGYMNQLTFNSLFKIDLDTLQPIPDLVESFENIDEVTWNFKLKEGVKFHDGTDLTSEDVKASLEFSRNFVSATQYNSFWSEVQIIDDHNFTIITTAPYAKILDDLASNCNSIVPSELIASGNDFNQNPIGSGPYKFVHWELGDSLTFVKNEEYFDQDHMPTITDMTWRIIPEGSSRTIALETGEVDMIIDVESNDVERIRESEELALAEVEGLRMAFFALNTENPMFSDVRVRRAINGLLDKEAIVEVAVNGQGVPSVSMDPSPYQGVVEDNAVVHDVDAALKLFEEAQVDPKTMKFTVICFDDTTRRTAEVIQGMLGEAGITMEIESLDFAAWLERYLAGDFEASLGGFSSSNILTYQKGLWHTATIGATNGSRVSVPELDALIEKALVTLDETERTAVVAEISAKVNELNPFIPLYTSTVIRAFDADLQGAKVSSSGRIDYADLHWAE